MKKQKLGHKFSQFILTLRSTISQGEISNGSIVIAYYILFSIFPIIIIIGNVLPLFRIDTSPIAEYLNLVFPDKVASFILPMINSLLKTTSTGYISFGIILAIWSFSNLVNAIRLGENRLYGVHQVELKLSMLNFIWTRVLTVLFTALMIIFFTAVSIVLVFGQQLLEFLGPIFHLPLTEINKIFSYRYPVVLLVIILAVAYLNYVLPNIKLKKRVIWPGVLVTVVGWLALSFLFSFYLHNFPISWENYGIVGTFIIFMLWLNLSAWLFLLGVGVNAAIIHNRVGELEYSAGRMASYIQDKRHQRK
ncbi:YihY/virulence factor BrkB family protein [Lactobacillus kefiranofaciens subsp. kefirgranum]|uniref:YihY/virulence factor BrkB family protein n=1 Tax=Lactobacillus kefiranofaciens TaxID=267818 RepID=UPI0006F1C0AD|nr:YihY/virulence factor BrkB family protein [Lactobacillus kefiranofaciens]KRL24819.1 ribonuclease BN [Lactobacillus kefiranofaciens subsp. kefirgranum DSM 10550 = JCM 8572]MCJ2171855.1 YihY/virulence factor BrkB family protein [Lactobacillus kefiranofaciens]MCP9330812.1 YihY/virulence factor BrkB family protein [Lactobacillus kefiranofaciens]MDF4142442.1 YihY/virulence factor BrkB family protein [Lactobacillus kefiranofaciens]PAK98824.1 ribonuclease BN-like family protein [Lactobacillus kefi